MASSTGLTSCDAASTKAAKHPSVRSWKPPCRAFQRIVFHEERTLAEGPTIRLRRVGRGLDRMQSHRERIVSARSCRPFMRLPRRFGG